ncbi:MAG: discoidin domain-containing protein, partial [Sphingobacteriales bacterium]
IHLVCTMLLFGSANLYAQVNLALNKIAAASTAGQPATNAVDNNTGTRWESAIATDPSWISVDLGAAYVLSSVVIDWEAANAANYQVQGSTNGSTWDVLATRTGGTFGTRTDTVAVSGNYRYVRIYCTARSPGNQWGYSIWSLKVYGGSVASSSSSTTVSNLNLAIGAVATASTNNQPARNANDGNGGTRWESAINTDPSWISLDLLSAKTLTSVVIDWEAANAAAYEVQGSNNNSTWTRLAARTGGTFGARTDTLAVSGSYRYVRVYGTARSPGNNWGYSIFEFKVYGSGGIVSSSSSTSSSSSVIISTSSSSSSSSSISSSVTSSSTSSVTSSTVPLGNISPLYNNTTPLEPETVVEFADRVETTFSDRGRDRHAREPKLHSPTPGLSEEAMLKELEQDSGYDHYLAHYWVERTVTVIIKDYVAKGGNRVDFDVYTQTPLGPKDFRVWFLGQGTVAQYYDNGYVGLVPGAINHYRRSLGGGASTANAKNHFKPIAIGDRMEIEVSQFLENPNPTNSRKNYYGTAILYKVGGGLGLQPNGIVPWEGKATQDTDNNGNLLKSTDVQSPYHPMILDSFQLPQKAWLGGRTTLPYQYSNEPMDKFKQLAGNMAGGQSIVNG